MKDKGQYRDVMDRLTVTAPMRERILKKIRQTDFSRIESGKSGTKHRVIRPGTMMRVIPAAAAAAITLVVLSIYPILPGQKGSSQPPEVLLSAQSGNSAGDEAAEEGTGAEERGAVQEYNLDAAGDAPAGGTGTGRASAEAPGSGAGVERASAEVPDSGIGVSCASAEELSETVGFAVQDLSRLPFPVDETCTEYTVIAGDVAQIVYTGTDGQQAVYRKAPGTDDVSGDTTEYPCTDQILLPGTESGTAADPEEAGGTAGSGASGADITVTLKGESGDGRTLAVWTDGEYSYSLSLSQGITVTDWKDLFRQNPDLVQPGGNDSAAAAAG